MKKNLFFTSIMTHPQANIDRPSYSWWLTDWVSPKKTIKQKQFVVFIHPLRWDGVKEFFSIRKVDERTVSNLINAQIPEVLQIGFLIFSFCICSFEFVNFLQKVSFPSRQLTNEHFSNLTHSLLQIGLLELHALFLSIVFSFSWQLQLLFSFRLSAKQGFFSITKDFNKRNHWWSSVDSAGLLKLNHLFFTFVFPTVNSILFNCLQWEITQQF